MFKKKTKKKNAIKFCLPCFKIACFFSNNQDKKMVKSEILTIRGVSVRSCRSLAGLSSNPKAAMSIQKD